MTTAHDPTVLPADIPAPRDDGAARHLQGARLPSVSLAATDGSKVDLSKLPGRTVLYVYPRTGVPGQAPPDGWDQIPGARGCTPQSCSFRDHFAELKRLGVSRLYGLSTQDTAYQREAVERLHLPFPVLSDESLELARAIVLEATLSFLGLGVQPPTPSWGGMIYEGREYLDSAWWISTFPGLVLMLTSLGVSRTGDWLRDLLDPTLRGE